MKYTKLGNTDLTVSKACLGCMGFGDPDKGMHSWTLNEEASREIIQYALSNGINFFDTAMAYQGGTSEEYLGNAIHDFARREDVVIATKFLPKPKNNPLSVKDYVNECLRGSLRRLKTDYIDLYILHAYDEENPIEAYLEVLHEAVKDGKVRYIGISNCFAWQLAVANGIAEKNGWTPFSSVQGHYNLIAREEEREMAPYCHYANIAMTPYSALASGRLARKPGTTSRRMEEDTYAKGKYESTEEQDAIIIRRVNEIAEKRNVSMSEVALSWLMNKTTSPVVGATKLHHIDTAAKACDLELSEQEIRYLEEPYVAHELVGMMARKA